MSIVITDKALLQQLSQVSDPVEIRDTNGDFIGTSAPPNGKLPPGIRSPISDEELDRRRTIREGKPLSEILKHLGETH
jgi:hypothetical protein